MLRDDDMFPTSTRPDLLEEHDELAGEPLHEKVQYANDDFDDVFGSEPPSPRFYPATIDSHEPHTASGNLEYSDIPRLKDKHFKEGYREGVTKGKGETVQAGFDEGYGLGAVLGLKIGKILGLLEGIYNALRFADGEEYKGERGRIEGVYAEAQAELTTQSVFGKEFWNEDGIWKFVVPGEEEGKEVVFPDVAAAHPLVLKWERVIQEEVERWGLDLQIMEKEWAGEEAIDDKGTSEEGHHHHHAEEQGAGRAKASTSGGKKPLEEGSSAPQQVMGVAKADLSW